MTSGGGSLISGELNRKGESSTVWSHVSYAVKTSNNGRKTSEFLHFTLHIYLHHIINVM